MMTHDELKHLLVDADYIFTSPSAILTPLAEETSYQEFRRTR